MSGVMVLGYVVMRTSMVFLWGQVARQDPGRAPAAHTSMWTIGFAQVGWLALALLGPSIEMFVLAGVALFALELAGPVLAQRKSPAPWHAQHIAEDTACW